MDGIYKLITFDYQQKKVIKELDLDAKIYQITRLDDSLIAFIGYSEFVTFYNYKTKKIVHRQETTGHVGNVRLLGKPERFWIKKLKRLNDHLIAYGGTDCKVSIFDYKKMKLLHETCIGRWLRVLEVIDGQYLYVHNGYNEPIIWDYINQKLLTEKNHSSEDIKVLKERGSELYKSTVDKEDLLHEQFSQLRKLKFLSYLTFLDDHTCLVAYEHYLMLINLKQKKVLKTVDVTYNVRKLIALNSHFIAILTDSAILVIYDLDQNKIVYNQCHFSVIYGISQVDESHLIYSFYLILRDLNSKSSLMVSALQVSI